MQELQLYIEGQRVELFKDESVSLTQSIQNVKDISKIFTDFSKTFSLPASKINSKIFKHYYNNDIVGGFDARKKKPANIELNNLPYKNGYIKLEGVELKNNLPHTYRVTFFGSTVSLKDILGEEKLQSLDLSANDTVYTAGNIRTSLQLNPTTNDLITPLITHTQRLFYSNVEEQGNLDYTAGEIKGVTWSDLKFSLRVDTIVQAITTKHSELVFSNDFFVSTNASYYNLFMWLHRKKGSVENFTGVNQVLINGWSTTAYDATETRIYTPTILQVAGTPSEYSVFTLSLSTVSTASYTAVIQKDGVEVYRETASSGGNLIINSITPEVGAYTVLIETSSDITFSQIEWDVTYRPSGGVFQSVNYPTGVFNLVSQFDFIISQQIPEMKTIDFLSGLFKMFNLTAYVDDATGKIVVKTLDSYYTAGSSYDVSKYIDVSKSSSNVALPYREINFQYEGVKTLLSAKFSQLSGKDWAKSSYDGGEKLDGSIYNIKLPFEHLQYERLNNAAGTSTTTAQYGFFVDKYKEEPNVENVGDPYINKPLLFYPIRQTSATPISFVFNSTSVNSITTYNIPSNSVALSSATSTANINFHNETNEYERTNDFTDTLFNVYYKKYISDVFTESNRITKLTAHLPLGITLKLNLNDRLIVNGKSYKINSITTNLNNGKSQLELLNEV
tara:strand:+ start:113 stop:2134 length:2022 start_codon:yes stop_codon:yes gene_type:complete